MKSSTIKMLKESTAKKKNMDYTQADSYYIEVYTNVKRVIKIEAIDEKQAIEKALKREERRKTRNCYEFVDCDYNVVEEKDYEAYRQTNQEIRRGRS